MLPMAPTTPAKMTHDYVRHGTTSLFATLDIASGSVIAQHLHLVLDNYATHKTEAVKKWLWPPSTALGHWKRASSRSPEDANSGTRTAAAPRS